MERLENPWWDDEEREDLYFSIDPSSYSNNDKQKIERSNLQIYYDQEPIDFYKKLIDCASAIHRVESFFGHQNAWIHPSI